MSSRRKTISEFCTSDRDCAFGLHCGGTGVCASGTTGNSAGQSCSNSPQCQVGLSCISGVCSSPSTTPTTTSTTTTPSSSNSSNNPVISASTNSNNNNLVNRNNSGSITAGLSRFLSGGTNTTNKNNNQVNQNNLANRNSQNNGCNNVTNQSSGSNLNNNLNNQVNQNNNSNSQNNLNSNNNSSNQNNQVLGSYTPPSQSQFTRSFIISYYNGKRNYLIVPSNGNPSFWSPDPQMQFTLFGDRGVLYAHEGTRDYPVEVTRSGYLVRSKMSSVFSLDENNRLVYYSSNGNSNSTNNNNFGVNNNNFVNNVGNNSLQIDENGKAYFITPSNINSVSEGGMDARITLY